MMEIMNGRSEYDIYRFVVKEGETFQVELQLSRDEPIFVMYFDGDSAKDIEDAMQDLVYYGDSDDVYEIAVADNRFASFSLYASSKIRGNIAIFSYSLYAMSKVSYTLYTSIPEGSRTSFMDVVIWIAIIVGIIVVIYFIKKKRDESRDLKLKSMNQGYTPPVYYSQPTYPQQPVYRPVSQPPPYQPVSQPPQEQFYCTNCGSANGINTKFCTICGNQH